MIRAQPCGEIGQIMVFCSSRRILVSYEVFAMVFGHFNDLQVDNCTKTVVPVVDGDQMRPCVVRSVSSWFRAHSLVKKIETARHLCACGFYLIVADKIFAWVRIMQNLKFNFL